MPVDVSVPEAIGIADFVRARFSEPQIDALRRRLEVNEQKIRPLSQEEHTKTNVRCAFLNDDGTCSIYEARPLACASFTSKSRARCEDIYNHPSDLSRRVPQDHEATAWSSGIRMGLSVGLLKARKVEFRIYELHSAALRALDDPKAAAKWAQGTSVFADCILRDDGKLARMFQSAVRLKESSTDGPQRNDPCPCRSGKKFKNCCMRGG